MKNSVQRIQKTQYINEVSQGLKNAIGKYPTTAEVIKYYNRFISVDDAVSSLIMKS